MINIWECSSIENCILSHSFKCSLLPWHVKRNINPSSWASSSSPCERTVWATLLTSPVIGGIMGACLSSPYSLGCPRCFFLFFSMLVFALLTWLPQVVWTIIFAVFDIIEFWSFPSSSGIAWCSSFASQVCDSLGLVYFSLNSSTAYVACTFGELAIAIICLTTLFSQSNR